MRMYTCSEARQKFASVWDGAARIGRRDGRSLVLQPESTEVSPLDVTTYKIVGMIRESLERYG